MKELLVSLDRNSKIIGRIDSRGNLKMQINILQETKSKQEDNYQTE